MKAVRPLSLQGLAGLLAFGLAVLVIIAPVISGTIALMDARSELRDRNEAAGALSSRIGEDLETLAKAPGLFERSVESFEAEAVSEALRMKCAEATAAFARNGVGAACSITTEPRNDGLVLHSARLTATSEITMVLQALDALDGTPMRISRLSIERAERQEYATLELSFWDASITPEADE